MNGIRFISLIIVMDILMQYTHFDALADTFTCICVITSVFRFQCFIMGDLERVLIAHFQTFKKNLQSYFITTVKHSIL